MSTLNTVNITNGTDSITVEGAVKGSAKAWVNFNGTGTVAIRASYNVSSITDNGTGDYTINFTTALVDANYAVCGGIIGNTSSGLMVSMSSTTSAFRFNTLTTGGVNADRDTLSLSIFR